MTTGYKYDRINDSSYEAVERVDEKGKRVPYDSSWFYEAADRIADVLDDYLMSGYDFIIVFGAGNLGYDKTCEFSNFFFVINEDSIAKRIVSVGAVGQSNYEYLPENCESESFFLANCSQTGDRVDVLAPEVDIFSSVPYDDAIAQSDNNIRYDILSGTSMATPFVAGSAAFVWALDPSLNGDEVVKIIKETATTPVNYPEGYSGPNMINLYDACLKATHKEKSSEASYSCTVVDKNTKSRIVDAVVGLDYVGDDGYSRTYYETTDENGVAHFKKVAYGTYDVSVTKKGYSEYKNGVNINSDAMVVMLDTFELTPNSEFLAKVYAEDTGDGMIHTLVADAYIYEPEAYENGGDPLCVFNGSDGSIKYNLLYGNYTVVYKCEGYEDYVEKNIVMKENEQSLHIITMKPVGSSSMGTFQGSIFDSETNEPLNADVYLFPSDYDIENYNVDDAMYHVKAVDGQVLIKVPAGAYRTLFVFEGYENIWWDDHWLDGCYHVSPDEEPTKFEVKMNKSNAPAVIDSGTCGDNLTWILTNNGILTISGTGAMNDYSSSKSQTAPWYPYADTIQMVSLDNRITTIGDYTFYGCEYTTINIPENVISIGEYSFVFCTHLTNINIPNSVTSIGKHAFTYCLELETVNMSNQVTEIGTHVFDHCSKLTYVKMPDSVTSIGRCAFSYCTSLTTIIIPDSVTSIEEYAFEGCTNLKTITIPERVNIINHGVFKDCCNLKTIDIPNGVTYIGFFSFQNCSDLTTITIPDSVTFIHDSNFDNSSNLTIYGLPNSYAQTFAKENNILFVAV